MWAYRRRILLEAVVVCWVIIIRTAAPANCDYYQMHRVVASLGGYGVTPSPVTYRRYPNVPRYSSASILLSTPTKYTAPPTSTESSTTTRSYSTTTQASTPIYTASTATTKQVPPSSTFNSENTNSDSPTTKLTNSSTLSTTTKISTTDSTTAPTTSSSSSTTVYTTPSIKCGYQSEVIPKQRAYELEPQDEQHADYKGEIAFLERLYSKYLYVDISTPAAAVTSSTSAPTAYSGYNFVEGSFPKYDKAPYSKQIAGTTKKPYHGKSQVPRYMNSMDDIYKDQKQKFRSSYQNAGSYQNVGYGLVPAPEIIVKPDCYKNGGLLTPKPSTASPQTSTLAPPYNRRYHVYNKLYSRYGGSGSSTVKPAFSNTESPYRLPPNQQMYIDEDDVKQIYDSSNPKATSYKDVVDDLLEKFHSKIDSYKPQSNKDCGCQGSGGNLYDSFGSGHQDSANGYSGHHDCSDNSDGVYVLT